MAIGRDENFTPSCLEIIEEFFLGEKLRPTQKKSRFVRINRSTNDTITLTIPDYCTAFPQGLACRFQCTVTKQVADIVKGYAVQVRLAIMLLNQHGIIKRKDENIIYTKKYSTFEGAAEDIDVTGPMLDKDGADNSCVDVILPFSAMDSKNQLIEFNLVVHITSQKD